MLSQAYIRNAVIGTWRVALMDRDALRAFDLTIDGFFRSFYVMLLVIAPYLALEYLRQQVPALRQIEGEVSVANLLFVKGAFFFVGWFAFVAIMVPVAKILRLSDYYVSYIIIWNWASILQIALILPAVALMASGLLPGGIAGLLVLFCNLAIIVFLYRIARIGLNADTTAAIVVVLLEIFVEVGFETLSNRLL